MSNPINKVKRAVRRLVKAEIEEAFKGSMHPDDHPAIEHELRVARNRYREALQDLAYLLKYGET